MMTSALSRLAAVTDKLDARRASLSRTELSIEETQRLCEQLDAWATILRRRKEFEEVVIENEKVQEIEEEPIEQEVEEEEYTTIEEAVTVEEEELATIDEEEGETVDEASDDGPEHQDTNTVDEQSDDEEPEVTEVEEESTDEEPEVTEVEENAEEEEEAAEVEEESDEGSKQGRNVVPSGNFFVAFDSPDRTLGFSVTMKDRCLVVDKISDVRLEGKILRGDTVVALGGEIIGAIEAKDRLDEVLTSIKEHPHPVVIMFRRH